MRQRVELNRKLNLLKKTNFFQYIQQYPTPSNSFMPNHRIDHDIPQKIHSLILPTVASRTDSTQNEQKKQTSLMMQSFALEETQTRVTISPIRQETKLHKNGMRETFRLRKKATILNVNELIATPMHPSNRKERKTLMGDRLQKRRRTVDVSTKPSFSLSQKHSQELVPKKRAYIGNICHNIRKVQAPPQLILQRERDQSCLCGWEQDFQTEF